MENDNVLDVRNVIPIVGDNNEAEVLPEIIEQGKAALRNMCLSTELNHVQIKHLLRTLRAPPFNLYYLPKDPRTLHHTPTVVVRNIIHDIAGGRYVHFGFKNQLQRKLESVPDISLPDRTIIDFRTDGGSVFKSTRQQFWPIQFCIFNVAPNKPIISGCYLGNSKPTDPFDFMNPFVTEVEEVIEEGGINVRGRLLPLYIRCLIADAPARAFILNHYSYNAPHACSKCKVEGYYSVVPNFERTRVFTDVENRHRTNEEYLDLSDEDILDSRLLILNLYCPSQFNRRPSELSLFHLYKATSFRQLLLYTCPVVFIDVFPPPYYLHFVLLHLIMRILSNDNVKDNNIAFCKKAMQIFVEGYQELYEENIMSYNLHGLLHVVDDVQKLGNVESYSAFRYENNRWEITKKIGKPGAVLEQYYIRFDKKKTI